MAKESPVVSKAALPILVSYQVGWVAAAVPKRRGRGYLKVPAGHHSAPWINEAEDAAGGVDIFGLDGWLEIELPYGANGREKFAALLPVLLREFKASCAIEASLAAVLAAHRRTNKWE